MSAIQICLRRPKGSLYGIFVDLRKAFDLIVHQLLWHKLYTRGISGKMIRIIKNLYANVNIFIELGELLSVPITYTKGVLQGDPLSPLLFAIFICDIEEHFRNLGLQGLSINAFTDILMLAYADDIVILANSPKDVQKKLTALESYCQANKLQINCDKTKVLYFHKGRNKTVNMNFHCEGQPIETVNSYEYLGILFSSSGLFRNHASSIKNKANIVNANIRNLLATTKTSTHAPKMKLFHSVLLPSILYAAETWSLRYMDLIEICQIKFFKNLFYWPQNTPSHVARLEIGLTKLNVKILSLTLNWWSKILLMPESRYPKACYQRLLRLDGTTASSKYNWATQLKSILTSCGSDNIWLSQNPLEIKQNFDEILENYTKLLYAEDIQRIENSTHCPLYKDLFHDNEQNINYFHLNLPLDIIRVFSQLRVSSIKAITIYTRGIRYTIDTSQLCTLCNLHSKEDFFHLLIECPIYEEFRKTYLGSILPNLNRTNFHITLLNSTDPSLIISLYNFIKQTLRIRSFVINE